MRLNFTDITALEGTFGPHNLGNTRFTHTRLVYLDFESQLHQITQVRPPSRCTLLHFKEVV